MTQNSLADAINYFETSNEQTLEKARNMADGRYLAVVKIPRRPQYNQYCQIIFRVFDQDGSPVKSFNVCFNSFGGEDKPDALINSCFKDGHPNSISPNTITFYIQRHVWEQTGRKVQEGRWKDIVNDLHGVILEIDATDHGNNLVQYLPLRYRLDQATLRDWLRPNQTTIVDVHLYRMPSDKVFRLFESD